MEAETKLVGLLINEESEPFEVPGFDCKVTFKRPTIAGKHKGKAWSFRKIKEYGYDPDDENSGTLVLQYWGQLNAYVHRILVDGKEYPFDPKVDTEYSAVFDKYTVEEVYNKGESEDSFVSVVIVLLAKWLDETVLSDDEVKNS
ncbi:MAG: hypothetical protein WC965_01925 [Thiohalomonadaceae bacterium]